jgi:hypothetical protein
VAVGIDVAGVDEVSSSKVGMISRGIDHRQFRTFGPIEDELERVFKRDN